MNNKETTKKTISPVLYFIICEGFFIAFFSVLLIYFGPFVNVKGKLVSALNGTSSQYKVPNTVQSNKIISGTKPVLKRKTVSKANRKVAAKVDKGIRIIDINGVHYKGKLILVKNPGRVNVGLTPYLGHSGATLKELIKKEAAVGGINAGGFIDNNLMGTGGTPTGIIIEKNKITYMENRIKTFSIIGFNGKNKLIASNNVNLKEVKKMKLRCAVSFGPVLISAGKSLAVSRGTSPQPRTAIGQRKDGTVLLLAIDGRQAESEGVNYHQLQNILLKYGAYNAANLDGGSSTTIIYQGKTLNNPSDILGERSISSAILIMP